LRALSVEALHKQAWAPHPIVDGRILREDLSAIYRHHHQNDVPLLVGWNAEEGKDLAPEILGTSDFAPARQRELATKLLGHAPSDALLAAYPDISQLTTDWWGWRMWYWAGLQARHGRAKSYVYYFTHQPAAPTTPCGYGCGAGHGAEIRYVFDQLGQDDRPWAAKDRQLAARLADTWAAFARAGTPNGQSLPTWPAFDGSNATVLRIGDDANAPLPDFSLFGQP
jgi:para-nitrobenzyl esterase